MPQDDGWVTGPAMEVALQLRPLEVGDEVLLCSKERMPGYKRVQDELAQRRIPCTVVAPPANDFVLWITWDARLSADNPLPRRKLAVERSSIVAWRPAALKEK